MKKYSIIENTTEVSGTYKGIITPGGAYDDNNTDKYSVVAQFDTLEAARCELKKMRGSVVKNSGYYSVTDFAIVDWVTADGHIIDTDESIDCFDIWDFARYDRNDTLPEEKEEGENV